MILSWILNSIHQDLVPTMLYTEFVVEVWADLRERFSPSNGPRIFHLEQKYSLLNKVKTTSLGITIICGIIGMSRTIWNPCQTALARQRHCLGYNLRIDVFINS
ncbi:hypothetical protein EUGRSUZ_F02285 [Eucalyptus grandis]|uniref:Uncharacterized protein n=2 Tax=Eucalyptus grandis TaxID=71139 RepID=A0ACC3KGQ0_EUCGR|nr:hypothetical protein EUGRSUZ_F02285 [Eucalyptus grandis]